MRKIVLITIFSLGFITITFAQNITSGIKGGLNLSSLSIDGNNDKNLKIGLHAGVFTKISFNESFAVQPELVYSGKGLKLDFADEIASAGETKLNLNYIELPVQLVYNLSNDFAFHFGPYLSYLLNANMKTDANVLNHYQISSTDNLDKKHFNSFDFGLTGGLAYDLNPFIFGFNYSLGLTQVAKDNDVSHNIFGDAKNNVIQVYAGFKF